MARRKSWFDRVKRFFVSDSDAKTEKVRPLHRKHYVHRLDEILDHHLMLALLQKERRRRWLVLRLKSKCSPTLPGPSTMNARSLKEAEEEQSKHAMAVAVATAAAAEAAVAAAQAAAQALVRGQALHKNSDRRWDGSILSKEEINAILKSRREAAVKRLRALEYASSYQVLQADDLNRRWRWLEEWVGAQPLDKDVVEINPMPVPEKGSRDQPSPIPDSLVLDKEKAEEAQLRYLARRSFIRSRTTSVRDDDSFSSSPSFPSYMGSTASTKARFRSMSTPKQRAGAGDVCFDQFTPYSNRILSPFHSVVSDISLSSKSSKPPLAHQRSPRLKGQAAPVRSHRPSSDLSFDSQCPVANWDQHGAFR
ncbi:hypothetical protein B296_00010604 [Ensete ventricosum]|uniref:DUF4005 domain-containing protein n=1 Tax=Ensete ventricosum TaxID=4639 RepID=A0A426YUQ5_ENSVE|nr:hypothetical protein B296_00010604 [Ensete ventricosum]